VNNILINNLSEGKKSVLTVFQEHISYLRGNGEYESDIEIARFLGLKKTRFSLLKDTDDLKLFKLGTVLDYSLSLGLEAIIDKRGYSSSEEIKHLLIERISEYREESNLSWGKLGTKIGMSRSYCSDMINQSDRFAFDKVLEKYLILFGEFELDLKERS
jgi:hypothetical protein